MKVRNVAVASTRFLLREVGSGDGTPVLLLHGVPETSSSWRDVAPALAADGRRVLAPDLPGLGGSSYDGPFDLPSIVEQVVALLDAELPGQRVDLVGHDWGGATALALAALHPERVRRLVVANTALRKVNPLRAAHMLFYAVPGVPEAAFRLAGKRLVDTMFRLAWTSDVALDPEAQAEYVAAYTEPARVKAMLGYYRAATRPKIAQALHLGPVAELPKVVVERSLVVWGADDWVLPISVGESIVKELGASCSMVTIPGAGHFVVEEAPEVFLQAVQAFLAAD